MQRDLADPALRRPLYLVGGRRLDAGDASFAEAIAQAHADRQRPRWGTVRRHLLLAAENKVARGEALRSRLYIPEPFSVDQRDVLNPRRAAQWSHAVATPAKPQQLMLLIGEVKEIVPARYGYKAVIKHVPDQAFALDGALYRRLGRRFDAELALWASADNVHMIVIATFGVSEAGIPTIGEMSLMPVSPQWLPIEDSFERQLVERLVTENRAFIKGLRYNLQHDQCVATATLTDMGDFGTPMVVVAPGLEGTAIAEAISSANPRGGAPVWVWQPASEAMPRFPPPVPRGQSHGRPTAAHLPSRPSHLETDTKPT